MKTLKFKTNINCSACVAKVTPVLDGDPSIEKWEVDITNSDKILTVEGEELNDHSIVNSLQKIGYKAEVL